MGSYRAIQIETRPSGVLTCEIIDGTHAHGVPEELRKLGAQKCCGK